MFRPLAAIVREKLQHYAKDRSGFEHLTLLVYYDMAVVHNSPPETPWFSFEDAAEKLSSMLGEDGGVFDQVIVFIAVTPGRRCLPVFPKVPAPTR